MLIEITIKDKDLLERLKEHDWDWYETSDGLQVGKKALYLQTSESMFERLQEDEKLKVEKIDKLPKGQTAEEYGAQS